MIRTCRLRRHVLNVRHIIMSSLGIHLGLGLLGHGSRLLDSLHGRGSSIVRLLGFRCPSKWAGSLERIGLEVGGFISQDSTVSRLYTRQPLVPLESFTYLN